MGTKAVVTMAVTEQWPGLGLTLGTEVVKPFAPAGRPGRRRQQRFSDWSRRTTPVSCEADVGAQR